jgi:arsenate reductase-like glutaredoxin family protein
MVTVYGIRSCDTVKRALKALDGRAVGYRFHDVKTDGLTPAKAQHWLDTLGLDAVLNRRGTTWRRLEAAIRASVAADNAASLLARRAWRSCARLPRLLCRYARSPELWSSDLSEASSSGCISGADSGREA